MMYTKTRSQGFTLIELLTVIAIIAVLAAIIFPVAATVREQARASDCMTKLHQLWVSANVYKQDEGAYPGVLMGYAFDLSGHLIINPTSQQLDQNNTDKNKDVMPADRILQGTLYNELVKDTNVFHCPDNINVVKNNITKAYLYAPGWQPPAINGQAVSWVGSVLNGCSDNYGTYDCYRESDGVTSTDDRYHKPKYFYTWDSFDLSPRIDPVSGQVVKDANGYIVYERHYGIDWTGEVDAAAQGSSSVLTKNDRTNQLQYANPPDDKTMFTYCTWHAATAGSNTVTILNMGGSAKKIQLDQMWQYGPNVFYHD